ncbi:MAG: hypothetical protein IPL52_14735 [Flavobacteriales bacterium]|nr:hypothetical protein [Flavobacteriales bacterium]
MSRERSFKAHARTASIGTVIGVALVLMMLGIQGFVLYNAKAIEQDIRENFLVQVFLRKGVKTTEVDRLLKDLHLERFTSRASFVTPEEAAELLKPDLGEGFLEALEGEIPIHPNIQLNLVPAYVQADSLQWIEQHLRTYGEVVDVSYNKEAAKDMEANFTMLKLGGLVFLGLLLFVAVALINNTIRLAIYSKRFLIRTMHLVGATRWFIKKPFLISGLWQGLVAAVLSIGALTALAQLGRRYVPGLLDYTDATALAFLFGAVLFTGLLIALLSTWFAVGRYLRMDHETLHWS